MILQQATSKQTKPFVIKHVSNSFDNETINEAIYNTSVCLLVHQLLKRISYQLACNLINVFCIYNCSNYTNVLQLLL